MDYNEAINYAKQGKTLMLPNWVGYFYWNYNSDTLYFKNNNYYLNNQQLIDLGILNRKDWYYII